MYRVTLAVPVISDDSQITKMVKTVSKSVMEKEVKYRSKLGCMMVYLGTMEEQWPAQTSIDQDVQLGP